MPAFSAQDIITRAAAAADMHDNFVTPAQWLAWFRVEVNALDLFLARLGLRGPTPPVQTFNNTANAGVIEMPATDVLAFLGVWEARDGRYFRRLRHMQLPDFKRPIPDTGTYEANLETGDAQFWNARQVLDGWYVYLSPKPPSDKAGSYFALAIYPQLNSVVPTLSTNVYYSAGIEEIVVLRLARRALLKEESDTSVIDRQLKDEYDKAEEWASSVVMTGQYAVRNADATERGWAPWSDPWDIYSRESWLWV